MTRPAFTLVQTVPQTALAGLAVDDRLRRQFARIAAASVDLDERDRLVLEWAGELMAAGASGHEAAHQIADTLKTYATIGWLRDKDLPADEIIPVRQRPHAILRMSRK